MAANVNFYGADPNACFQDDNTVITWSWLLGDNYSYWGFSVRPYQANMRVSLTNVTTQSDNDLVHTTFLTVSSTDPTGPNIRERGGGLLRFTAIGSS
jgi:hypothetical protein